jgi:hypothetical protein
VLDAREPRKFAVKIRRENSPWKFAGEICQPEVTRLGLSSFFLLVPPLPTIYGPIFTDPTLTF